ncbi:hypothetical protein JCM6882_006672 [Rhodosporidiobolus microsporus]
MFPPEPHSPDRAAPTVLASTPAPLCSSSPLVPTDPTADSSPQHHESLLSGLNGISLSVDSLDHGASSSTPPLDGSSEADNGCRPQFENQQGDEPSKEAELAELWRMVEEEELDLETLYKHYQRLIELDNKHLDVEDEWTYLDGLLPGRVVDDYRLKVARARKRGDLPSISSDLLALYEGLETRDEWSMVRRMDKLDALATKLQHHTEGYEFTTFAMRKHRRWRRQREILWLDDLWRQCVDFEAANGITEEEHVRARYRRFPKGVFPTLPQRNEAEREAVDTG